MTAQGRECLRSGRKPQGTEEKNENEVDLVVE